ncbi:MAG: hypothetical protein ACYS8K_08555 [Planctomycetota bacterium]|jgi:hypothetical protein
MNEEVTTVSKAVWDWRGEGAGAERARPVLPRLLKMLAVMALFAGIAWWRGHRTAAACLGAFAVANVLLAALWPGAFRTHAGLWEKLGRAGALVVGTVALTAAYYLLFAPAALVLKALGRRPLKLRFPGSEKTYWETAEQRPDSEAGYGKQF